MPFDATLMKQTFVPLEDDTAYGIETKDGGGYHRFTCCDCGLVHEVKLWIDKKTIVVFEVERNDRSTAQRRRHGKPGLLKGIGKWIMKRKEG